MFFRNQMKVWLGIAVSFVLFAGLFSFAVFAAENGYAEVSYLPLVMKPEQPTATPTPTATSTPTATPTPTATSTSTSTSTPEPQTDFEEQVVILTNQERQKYGCGPLTMDARLRAAAEGHSQDMALNDFFDHTGSDGSTVGTRVSAQGYSWSWVAENIAAGYPSPESVVAGWMASSGHRANILNCNFVHIGVGYYYLQNDTGNENWHHYWTQVFAKPLN
jgi:uncharacterized protein YkwD